MLLRNHDMVQSQSFRANEYCFMFALRRLHKKIRPNKFCAGGWSGVDRVINGGSGAVNSDMILITRTKGKEVLYRTVNGFGRPVVKDDDGRTARRRSGSRPVKFGRLSALLRFAHQLRLLEMHSCAARDQS